MAYQTRIEVCRGEKEWTSVKECFVRAFHHYPLYKYLIPNAKIRPNFLRGYLEAVYDVTVRSGNSVLLCAKMYENNGTNSFEKEECQDIIIGGVLLVPPSESGGWECAKDEYFWEAYKKYGLEKLDSESLRRINRYEEWEYNNLTKRICNSGIPMWNGIFCGIDPTYAGYGCGRMSYADCLIIVENFKKKHPVEECENNDKYEVYNEPNFERTYQEISRMFKPALKTKHEIGKSFSGLLVKMFHSFAMLSHRSPMITDFLSDEDVTKNTADGITNSKEINTSERCSPLLFALSHSRKAARFHCRNGFRTVTVASYIDIETERYNSLESPITIAVMVLNPAAARIADSSPPRIIPCNIANIHITTQSQRNFFHDSLLTERDEEKKVDVIELGDILV